MASIIVRVMGVVIDVAIALRVAPRRGRIHYGALWEVMFLFLPAYKREERRATLAKGEYR
jgi:hypothetical protein